MYLKIIKKRYNKMDYCLPRYGKCVKGTRYIPVKVLDVAGLVPGASEGKVNIILLLK